MALGSTLHAHRRGSAALFAGLGVVVLGSVGCSVDVHVILPGAAGLADGTGDGDETTEGDGAAELGHGTDDTSGDPDPFVPDGDAALDLGTGESLADRSCEVGQLDAPLPCLSGPIAATIAPSVAWTWTGPAGEDSVLVTPLVANLDDDNGDGALDLCDSPEVLALAVDLPAASTDALPPGHLYLLDGATGAQKRVIDHPLDATATPALADLDGDGEPEILAIEQLGPVEPEQLAERRVVAFTPAGELLWVSEVSMWTEGGGALAVADLDGDGSPEILTPQHVLTADGALLWSPPDPPIHASIPLAVDLDLDGRLEVLFGGSVYAHDGTLAFDLELPAGKNTGVAAVANFDEDPMPEVYVQSGTHRILEHDGTLKAVCPGGGGHPVAIDDLDGDGGAEILTVSNSWFRALRVVGDHCETLWSNKLDDLLASASGTAFDLTADGTPNPIYADLHAIRVFDEAGVELASIPREARSSLAIPVVVDLDNDGAGELLVVGSEPVGGDVAGEPRATVLMVENAEGGFAPTRRIWNQHAYHGTNIREDARVPAAQFPHWLAGNSFRANPAPNYAGQLCQAPPVD